jgi:hypothetical protein
MEIQHKVEEGAIERDFFADRIAWRVNRDDAFATLPYTFVYFIVFMLLIIFHLQIYTCHRLEQGQESWFINWGKRLYGPFLDEHVLHTASFTSWIGSSGLEAALSGVIGTPEKLYVEMAPSNLVVGDVALEQYKTDDYTMQTVWLLGSLQGKEHLKQHPNGRHRFVEAAQATASHYLDPSTGWLDDEETKRLTLTVFAYCNQAEMFTISEVYLPLDRFGHITVRVRAKAVIMNAYPTAAAYVFDAVYILMILWTTYKESQDMCASLRLGCVEFMQYWTFWNIVDWCTISLGCINTILWILSCTFMQAQDLQELLEEVDGSLQIRSNLLPLGVARTEQLHDSIMLIYTTMFALRISVAITAGFMVLKFFKGFEANPRLQIVRNTLVTVSTDVGHFAVVFVPIFACFAVIGHVLFGQDLNKFHTIGSSFNTGVAVLMGEFSWYTDLSDTPSILPSGMPRVVLAIWFILYTAFVILVMLNMLLAIILDQYVRVAASKKAQADARTIFQQAIRTVNRRLETQGFVPLYKIKHLLEYDADPAHKPNIVTEESIKEAFNGVSDEQAAWLMRFVRDQLQEKMMTENRRKKSKEAIERAVRTEQMTSSIAEELHNVHNFVADCMTRLNSVEANLASDPNFKLAPLPPPPPLPEDANPDDPTVADEGLGDTGLAKVGSVPATLGLGQSVLAKKSSSRSRIGDLEETVAFNPRGIRDDTDYKWCCK